MNITRQIKEVPDWKMNLRYSPFFGLLVGNFGLFIDITYDRCNNMNVIRTVTHFETFPETVRKFVKFLIGKVYQMSYLFLFNSEIWGNWFGM